MALTAGQIQVVGQELTDGVTISNLNETLYTLEFTTGVISVGQYAADLSAETATLAAYEATLAQQIAGAVPFAPITYSQFTVIPTGAVCYLSGTRIKTPAGEVPVEDLKSGDCVETLGHGVQQVRWVGHRRIDLSQHPLPARVAPISIGRNAFAEGVPSRDLLVSPDHAIYVEGVLVCARALVNGATIRQDNRFAAVDYYHVELDMHAVLFAEGLTAESYLDTGNRGFFANGGAPLVLHPDMSSAHGQELREAGSCAPFVDHPDMIRPIWQKLAERAMAMGATRRDLRTTNDPDLMVLADGSKLHPIVQRDGFHTYCVPAGTSSLRLVSRATAPSSLRPWVADERTLGVAVSRIVLRQHDDLQQVPLDHVDLAEGWLDLETDGSTIWRWTNGNAELPLPVIDQACLLDIRIQGGQTYLLTDDVTPARLVA